VNYIEISKWVAVSRPVRWQLTSMDWLFKWDLVLWNWL